MILFIVLPLDRNQEALGMIECSGRASLFLSKAQEPGRALGAVLLSTEPELTLLLPESRCGGALRPDIREIAGGKRPGAGLRRRQGPPRTARCGMKGRNAQLGADPVVSDALASRARAGPAVVGDAGGATLQGN